MSADPDFPYLTSGQRISFPSVDSADRDGVVAVGANLSPGVLLSAYEQGIFPWFEAGLPILWWSPDPRFVLQPEHLHIPRRLKRVLRNGGFDLSFDADFDSVISLCSRVPRRGQQGTWITQDMIRSYRELHRLGYAHSVEVHREGRLVGGLYGLLLG
ncbi:MAG: leucyl/phenylalanyl-tRNA--protein transferase, partial [Spirochaetota bacterium]